MHIRFLPYATTDAAMNMAIDEAILNAHAEGLVPPTLRLYGFAPSAVSIGAGQKMSTELVERIQRFGVDVVRRPTGGRAVLHQNDLTYSFVGSSAASGGFLGATIHEAYTQISEGLRSSLSRLGIAVELGATSAPYRQLQDCFLATTGADLHYHGTKIMGSAQLRRRNFVLQHGSLPLNQEQSAMAGLLDAEHKPDESKRRHVNLFEVAERQFTFDEFNYAFALGFADKFGTDVRTEPLTAAEQSQAEQLRALYLDIHGVPVS